MVDTGNAGPRILLDTRDVDQAREAVAASYCPHLLSVKGRGRAFHAVQSEADLGAISVHHLEYGADTFVDPLPLAEWLLVSTPLQGRLEVSSYGENRTLGRGDTVVLDPYRRFSLRFLDGCRLLTMRFPRRLVEDVLGELTGGDAPVRARFEVGGPPSRRAASTWHAVSRLITSEAEGRGVSATHPLLRAQLERAAVVAVAETHPGRFPVHQRVPRTMPAAVQRAAELMEEAPDRPLRLSDLAAAARLGPRALQEAFQRHLGLTPMEFLREVRLRRAHGDLVAADRADGATVTDIAYRWGFPNPGRFARDYAKRYGCPPSETLRR